MRIKNWHELQHFKDRTPPWIKLYRNILEQRDIMMISDCSFRVLIGLWLLASEDKDMEGRLPCIEDIAFRLRKTDKEINKAIQELGAFIIHDDIKAISQRHQGDAPETYSKETEVYKKETEKEYMFEEFWNQYGIKKGRAKCEVKYKHIIKSGVKHKTIMQGLGAYQSECRKKETAPEFIKHPLTWLNGKNWEDEYERELTREEREAEVQRIIDQQQEAAPCRLIS